MNENDPGRAWQVDEQTLRPDASPGEKLRFALRYAVLAPSSHNTQPWRFLVDGDTVALCADRLRALPVADPYDRELVISCGAALMNLRIALAHLGLPYAITLFPSPDDPDVLAHLRVVQGGRHDRSLPPLFRAITQRVTTRAPFADEPVAPALQQHMIEAGAAEGADVACIDSPVLRTRVAELVAEADRAQFADARFRRELAGWIHPRRLDDGMPAYAAGVSALLDFATPIVALAIRTFDVGDGVAAAHAQLASGSPLIVAIGTQGDDAPSWLAAGQALERVLLVGADAGLTASYLNQPIEVDALRRTLRDALSLDATPQLLLRMGRGPTVAHAPRRPIDAVVSP